MNRILYFHGLASSGATQTAEYLRAKLPNMEVISPDIPLNPTEALEMLHTLCRETDPFIIIGTSMGAMFAQQMHGYRKILVNPAFHVSEIMRQNMGANPFFSPRKDGATEFVIDESLCQAYEEMEAHQFDGITDFDREHTWGLFGTEDDLVHGYDEYCQYYHHATLFPGGHRLLQKWVKAYVLPCVARMILEG